MIGVLESRMEDVYDVVLVANTPAYLYKNLRRVLFDLANVIPFHELVSDLRREVASSPSDEYDQASYIYTLFILMTYGRYEEVRQQLSWIRSIKVKWLDYLTNHYERNTTHIESTTHSISFSLTESSYVGQSSYDLTTMRIDLK